MKKSLIVLGWVFIAACGVKTKLSNEDLKWVDYKSGDTIVFRSSRGNFDTIFITERKVFFPDYNPVELHDKYLPQMASVKAKRREMEEFSLVELEKREPDEPATWGIEIRFPGFFDKNSDVTKIVNSKLTVEHGSIYELSHNDNDIEAFNSNKSLFVAHTYLTLNYRILAYEMSDGELFERIK